MFESFEKFAIYWYECIYVGYFCADLYWYEFIFGYFCADPCRSDEIWMWELRPLRMFRWIRSLQIIDVCADLSPRPLTGAAEHQAFT